MNADALRPMTEQEKLKYEAATELGLIDRLLKVGWGGLTAGETGRIGGLVAQKMRRLS
ncbi:MAG: small, acid-soluble spore protein, alpha/beta type [Clostridia bacterium]|nr:small, acid-soluble spore protein, alpha/beta type [Clostridia bacterium]